MLLLALAGCTTTSSTPTISKTLHIYLSNPASLASDQEAQDVVRGEQLAFSQLHAAVRGYKLSLAQQLTADKISSNARTAIQDSHAIAYLGETVPGSSADSIGITNSQDLLQVSPTDGAVALTQKSSAVPKSPDHYYESFSTYGHTFARLVPTTNSEAAVLLNEMSTLGVRTLHVETDGSDYGRALAAAVSSSSSGISQVSSVTAAGAVLYAGEATSHAASALNSAAAASAKVKLFAPDALANPAFVAHLSPAAQRAIYFSTPGVLPSGLTAAGRTFVSDFRSTYGHTPASQAIFGYAAMQAVLHVLAQAGSGAGNRSTVVSDFMKLNYPDSVLGPYSIDKQGDTTFKSFVIERVRGGTLVAVKAA